MNPETVTKDYIVKVSFFASVLVMSAQINA